MITKSIYPAGRADLTALVAKGSQSTSTASFPSAPRICGQLDSCIIQVFKGAPPLTTESRPQRSDRPAGDGPAAADDAQPLVGLGLDAQAVPGNAEERSEDVFHGRDVRAELRRFGDDDRVDV